MNVVNKMRHFLVSQVKPVESVLHAWQLSKLVGIRDSQTPRSTQTMFDSLELPQEIVDLLKDNHHFIGEDGVEHRQVINSVIELEDFPSPVARTCLEKLDVKPMLELLVVVLGIAGPHSSFKISHQCVTIDLGCRLSQLFGQKIHQVLHEVTLTHQKIFADRKTVAFKLKFVKEYLYQRLISYLICMIDPFI